MANNNHSLYPTTQHANAAAYASDFFSRQEGVEAVLLTCSCARGKAVPASCVDISVLVRPGTDQRQLEMAWAGHSEGSSVVSALAAHGKYAHIDIEVTDGLFTEGYHGPCSGPDEFELEIGNLLHYSAPIFERGPRFRELKKEWLPYYSSQLRERRLASVKKYCLNNIDHIAPYVERKLYFQAFRRLYNPSGEFLQALFIHRRKYPIAYDKWIREQLEEILGLPELYPRFVSLLSVKHFESDELREKAEILHDMLSKYCVEGKPSSPSDAGDGR